MSEQYYAILFDDPALPSFCSGAKMYIGTLSQIGAVMEVLQKNGEYPNSVQAWKEYCNGNQNASHGVAYQEEPLLRPVSAVFATNTVLGEKSWDHMNTWGFPYHMKFSKADVQTMVFELNGAYFRCFRAWMTDLRYAGTEEEWQLLTDGFWGNGFILSVSQDTESHTVVNNLLFEVDRRLAGWADTDKDAIDWGDVDFAPICEEVFGNG